VKTSGGKKSQASLIIYDAVKSQEYFICTLISDVVPHTHLDLFFVGNREVTFRVHGNSNLHLTGYTTFLETDRISDASQSEDEDDLVPNVESRTHIAPPKTVVQELRESERGDEQSVSDDLGSDYLELGSDGESEPVTSKKPKSDAKDAKDAKGAKGPKGAIGAIGAKGSKGSKGSKGVKGVKTAKPKQSQPTPNLDDDDVDGVESATGKNDDTKKRKVSELKKGSVKPQQPKKQKTQSPKGPKAQPQSKKPQEKGGKSSPATKPGGQISCTGCQKKFPSAAAMNQHAAAKHKAK